ncbi:hypothetical protein K439DRAFT_1645513 [Ramaria rubella]|nr:hypothetical protein K439DRAFT_1645513 [Ramaria rubella]
MEHLQHNGRMLGVGQSSQPASMYDNPQLYSQAFPWLFPYGLGGVGNMNGAVRVPDKLHLKHLMLYHDKRFQTDPDFPLVAFNHQQIKDSSTGSCLLVDRVHFDDIVEPCYRLINDLDHVSSHVEGSGTTRKFMQNECWSLLAYLGAPTWYITFAPPDVKHPIALYLAAHKEKIRPILNVDDANYKLIADNPVASARFFNMSKLS